MKLIFIYGRPATGKLTVAKELEKITDYKLFHNHYAYDLIRSIFDRSYSHFFDLVQKTMLDVISAAAKENIPGVIFTYCYDPKYDASFVKKVIKIINKYNRSIHFVHLKCEKDELFKRVKNKSRKRYRKVKTIKGLKESLRQWQYKEISFVKNFNIDNTKLKPKTVAKKIQQKFNL